MTRENNPTASRTFRAGRYLPQVGGYRAFVPAPLPPVPPVHLGDELQKRLSMADRALGRLDGSVQTLPNPDLFVMMYVRKEAVLSCQIEGTQSSLQDLLAAEAQVLDPKRPRDVVEVVNYVRALHYGLEHLSEPRVSVRLIRQIHARLLEGTLGSRMQPGELRSRQNWIHTKRGNVRPTAAGRSTQGANRTGDLLTHRKLLTTAHQDRAGTRAVRDHSPIS